MVKPLDHDLEDRLYATVTVGERGQIVIPAQARKDFQIKPGDRLAVVRGMGDVAIVLINTKHFTKFFSNILRSIGKIQSIISKQ